MQTFDVHISHKAFDFYNMHIDANIARGAIFKKDFVVLRLPHNEIISYLDTIDSIVPVAEFDHSDIADFYLSVDAGLQQYYHVNGITG